MSAPEDARIADPVRITDPVKTARCMAVLPAGCFGSRFCGREIYLGRDGEWRHLDWSYHQADHAAQYEGEARS